jgi:hypothetical protein
MKSRPGPRRNAIQPGRRRGSRQGHAPVESATTVQLVVTSPVVTSPSELTLSEDRALETPPRIGDHWLAVSIARSR